MAWARIGRGGPLDHPHGDDLFLQLGQRFFDTDKTDTVVLLTKTTLPVKNTPDNQIRFFRDPATGLFDPCVGI